MLRERGLTVLVTEQQVPLAMAFSDRGYVLENGFIRLEGTLNSWQQIRLSAALLSGCDMIANILDGIVLGLQFGLLAAGLTLVYGLGGVLNLAYGQMAVTSAMAVALAMDAGMPVLPGGWARSSRRRSARLNARSDDPAPGLPSARRGTGPAQPAAHPGRVLHRRRLPQLALSPRASPAHRGWSRGDPRGAHAPGKPWWPRGLRSSPLRVSSSSFEGPPWGGRSDR